MIITKSKNIFLGAATFVILITSSCCATIFNLSRLKKDGIKGFHSIRAIKKDRYFNRRKALFKQTTLLMKQ
jgi:hypothetical protein